MSGQPAIIAALSPQKRGSAISSVTRGIRRHFVQPFAQRRLSETPPPTRQGTASGAAQRARAAFSQASTMAS
jgi:hypothetical protein